MRVLTEQHLEAKAWSISTRLTRALPRAIVQSQFCKIINGASIHLLSCLKTDVVRLAVKRK